MLVKIVGKGPEPVEIFSVAFTRKNHGIFPIMPDINNIAIFKAQFTIFFETVFWNKALEQNKSFV